MPELPDVEIFKQYIDATSLYQPIAKAHVKHKKILEDISEKTIKNKLEHHTFDHTHRHGKYLFIEIKNAGWLVLHFGMTGEITYYKSCDEEPPHTRLLITFDNGYHLAFRNQRLLGKIGFTKDKDQYIQEKNLGVDALDLKYETFHEYLEKRHAMIKSTLMNQNLIAGIGNIYADEILFQSGIHPKTKTNTISNKKIQNIYHNLREVLQVAIDAQANTDEFPDDYIIPHRQKNGVCPKGNEQLGMIKVTGRTTYFCPVHQKKN